MSTLSQIAPKEPSRLIDLVKAAGVDVSNWAKCKGGAAKAAGNPKYCFEWSFAQPNKVVVLNLWHNHMQERPDGSVFMDLNLRKFADSRSGIERVRALRTDEAIQTAVRNKLPIRVIVLAGKRRDILAPGAKPSHVAKRLLDPLPWAVTYYDWSSGGARITRGIKAESAFITSNESAIDDLADAPPGTAVPDRASVVVQVIKRDAKVRAHALRRAKGKCEYCNTRAFRTNDGGFYLETHHIIALCASGRDTVDNVIALCPLHHREAHYGVNGAALEAEFIKILERLSRRR
jgi:5-methylcytosine-specific restriction protein A